MPLSGELTLLLSLSFQSRVVVAVMDLAPGGFFASGGRGGGVVLDSERGAKTKLLDYSTDKYP